MKRKNLERAVFFTVLMMSLHNGAWAEINEKPVAGQKYDDFVSYEFNGPESSLNLNGEFNFNKGAELIDGSKMGYAQYFVSGADGTVINVGEAEGKEADLTIDAFALALVTQRNSTVTINAGETGRLHFTNHTDNISFVANQTNYGIVNASAGGTLNIDGGSMLVDGKYYSGITVRDAEANIDLTGNFEIQNAVIGTQIFTHDGSNNGTTFNLNADNILIKSSDELVAESKYSSYGLYIANFIKDKNVTTDVDLSAKNKIDIAGHRYGVAIAGAGDTDIKADEIKFTSLDNDKSGYGLWISSNGGMTNQTTTIQADKNFTAEGSYAGVNLGDKAVLNIQNTGIANFNSGYIGAYVKENAELNIQNTNVLNIKGGQFGLYANSANSNVKTNNLNIGVDSNYAISLNSANADFDITDTAQINGNIRASASSELNLDAKSTQMTGNIYSDGSTIKINSLKNGTINFTGATGYENSGKLEMYLTDIDSVWNLTATSGLTTLEHTNSIIDMTKDGGISSELIVDNYSGDNGVIKMDIDASKNTDNSDKLYINNHSGLQYITLNTINGTEDTNAVVGTVLASVVTENGQFKAKDVEGALYWNSFDLSQKESAKEGFKTDWYISGVEQQSDKGTTSVDTIVGANALNYHTWRAENDQLMQRMGELRNNGSDEQGAWFRMHGAEISHDDIAGFENKYTTYELGYDQITKQTENMTRYTGAALSYTDGSSSYNSGSGENHSKAISFYNTDIYSSGHYLDLVFKFANMDNDFSVYDTKGQNITGEYKNNGISLSAEYGRKNEMANGWYIEPQAQLTLGYFGGDEYETSNGIKVNQGGIASVLGRAGFNIGKELGGNGVIYAKASLLHEFAGDYDIRMTDSTGISRNESASFNDTWFEYGVGAALKTGKNNHLYFDFVKTAGGSFEKDWQWNAGMRWTF